MPWLAALPWVELIGWAGSVLVVWSLMQARLLRFRWMNLVGSLLATGYNAWAGIWPFVAMNGAIAIIDAYWINRLQREARSGAGYEVLAVPPDDAYLRHLLRVHREDIAATHPGFAAEATVGPPNTQPTDTQPTATHPTAATPGRHAWLVLRGDETVGAVVLRTAGAGTAVMELDWVSPRFRDFTPGRFVHGEDGIFTDLGLERVVFPHAPRSMHPYLRSVGFTPVPGSEQDRWERDLSTPPR